jgi:hypothetical protein
MPPARFNLLRAGGILIASGIGLRETHGPPTEKSFMKHPKRRIKSRREIVPVPERTGTFARASIAIGLTSRFLAGTIMSMSFAETDPILPAPGGK